MWPSSLPSGGRRGPLAGLGGTCPGSYHRGVGDGTWRQSASVGGLQRRCFTQQFHLEQLILNNQGVDHSLGVCQQPTSAPEVVVTTACRTRCPSDKRVPTFFKEVTTCVILYTQEDEKTVFQTAAHITPDRGVTQFCCLSFAFEYLLIFL